MVLLKLLLKTTVKPFVIDNIIEEPWHKYSIQGCEQDIVLRIFFAVKE